MNQSIPRRDAKLSRRLRTNETERVTLVRKCEVFESKLREGLRLLNLANEEIKRLKGRGLKRYTFDCGLCIGPGDGVGCSSEMREDPLGYYVIHKEVVG